MPDDKELVISPQDIAKIQAKITKVGAAFKDICLETATEGGEIIVDHARARHFFVGTGVGAEARARDGELKYMNPDGSLRFKVHTGNLRNSIQARQAKLEKGAAVVNIIAGQEYAAAVEMGRPGARAFPFLRPALEASRGRIIQRLSARLSAYLKRTKVD